jgi:hypothetical protein
MRVLVNESLPGTADHAVGLLASAGHQVLRCHERGERPFPCLGVLDADECPIRAGVDVALTVRGGQRPEPSPFEDGMACAIRARIPVVVAGHTLNNPFEAVGAEADEGEHVVGACERVATAPSPGHTAVARAALEHGTPAGHDVTAVVYRRPDGLRVELEGASGVPHDVLVTAVPKVLTELRLYDTGTDRIDVSIVEQDA